MLDTHARRFVEPLIQRVAHLMGQLGLSATGVTILALLVGLISAACVAAGWPWIAIGALWTSGLLDAADGALARMTRSSPLGAILDITFDRVVEIGVIVSLAWHYPASRLECVILAGVIAIAMSLFLSIAAALRNQSIKSFHYAPGLGERTEAFICLSLMIGDADRLRLWTWVFIAVIVFTVGQRLLHLAKCLRANDCDQ